MYIQYRYQKSVRYFFVRRPIDLKIYMDEVQSILAKMGTHSGTILFQKQLQNPFSRIPILANTHSLSSKGFWAEKPIFAKTHFRENRLYIIPAEGRLSVLAPYVQWCNVNN